MDLGGIKDLLLPIDFFTTGSYFYTHSFIAGLVCTFLSYQFKESCFVFASCTFLCKMDMQKLEEFL